MYEVKKNSEAYLSLATAKLRTETYVDDTLSGSHSLSLVCESLSKDIKALHSAGLPPKKITSNQPEIIKKYKRGDLKIFENFSTTKALGIQWNVITDQLPYTIEHIHAPSTNIM